jgi:hypothetical protein
MGFNKPQMADMVAGCCWEHGVMNHYEYMVCYVYQIVMGIVDYYHTWELLHEASSTAFGMG